MIRALADEPAPRVLGVHKHFIQPFSRSKMFRQNVGKTSSLDVLRPRGGGFLPHRGAGRALFNAAAAARFRILPASSNASWPHLPDRPIIWSNAT